MSFRARLLNPWLRRVERPALAGMPSRPISKVRNRYERQARLFFRAPRATFIKPVTVCGVNAREVGPESVPRILYFHGGAYLFGSPKTHQGMLARITRRCGIRALLPDYPLAPENPFPAAPETALAIYREVIGRGPVILGGDSAGGGLALSLLAMICDAGLPQPRLTFALSPWTDLTLSGDSHAANAASEVILPPNLLPKARDLYLKGADPSDRRASPVFADFSGAGRVRIWTGTTEILLDDSRRMITRLAACGVDAKLTLEPDLPHIWPQFPGWMLPEAEMTLDQIAAEIQTSLDSASR